jgi:hypothetical protein
VTCAVLLDKTGITGGFDFSLDYVMQLPLGTRADVAAALGVTDIEPGLPVAASLREQLGLRVGRLVDRFQGVGCARSAIRGRSGWRCFSSIPAFFNKVLGAFPANNPAQPHPCRDHARQPNFFIIGSAHASQEYHHLTSSPNFCWATYTIGLEQTMASGGRKVFGTFAWHAERVPPASHKQPS